MNPDKIINGYLDSELFLCGGYVGSSVSMANIRYIEEYAIDHGIDITIAWEEEVERFMKSDDAPIIIKGRYAYGTEQLFFNAAKMQNEQPDLWETIENCVYDYPLIDDELHEEIVFELVFNAWQDCYFDEITDNLRQLLIEDGYTEDGANDVIARYCNIETAARHLYEPESGCDGFIIETGCSVYINTDMNIPAVRRCFRNVVDHIKDMQATCEGHPRQRKLFSA